MGVEGSQNRLAAILPDGISPDAVSSALGECRIAVSPPIASDNGSTWLLNPKDIRILGSPLRMVDSDAFGTA
jgi:hypothetical protein